MPYAHVNRSALYYDIRGDGPALVFVPGLGLSHAVWAPQLSHFGQRHTAIGVDLRGAGRSGRLRGGEGAETHAADLLALLDKLGAQEAVFCGSGYGGVVAQLAALERPERCRGLVLADSPDGRAAGRIDSFLAPLHLLPGSWLVSGVRRHYVRWPEAQARLVAELGRWRGREAMRTRLALRRAPLDGWLGALESPLLGIVGDASPVAREKLRTLVARVPQARLSVLEDAAEPCNLCQPFAFNTVLERFLQRLD